MEIEIIRDKISLDHVHQLALATFGDMVKVVVDIERGIMAAGGQMHYDCEQKLLADGSYQKNLWGVNINFEDSGIRIEYTSLINIRPRVGNRSQEVQSPELRSRIEKIINQLVV